LGPKPQRQDRELFGDVKNQQGHVDESREIWLKTMKLSGSEEAKLNVIARNHTRNAQKFRQAGDLPRAEIEARRAVTLAKKDASAATEFAEVLLRRNVLEAASKWAEQARKIDPFNHYSLLVAGRIAEGQKDLKKARRLYAEVPSSDAHYREAQSRISRL
jgi:tetratricopeptide (TPR) repeat protein